MKGRYIFLAASLTIWHYSTEVHSVANKLWPDKINNSCSINHSCPDWFLSPAYHNHDVSIQWYLKMIFDDFLYVIILIVGAVGWLHKSVKMYFIFIIWALYHLADIINFIWNYKQSAQAYPIMLYAATLATVVLIIPHREKMHSVK